MTAATPTRAEMRRRFLELAAAKAKAQRLEQQLALDCSRYASATGRWGLRPEAIRQEVGA